MSKRANTAQVIGASGSSLTYGRITSLGASAPSIWVPSSGTTGNPITYRIGQDSSHNGTAIFNGANTNYWLGYQASPRVHDVVISGDAGDGAQHFVLTNYPIFGVGQEYTNVTINFVSAPSVGLGMDFNNTSKLKFHNNLVRIVDMNSDHFTSMTVDNTAITDTLIYSNTIYLPIGTGGIGADGFQINGVGGWSFYNNIVIGYATNYTGGQHMDGWQGQGGSNIRIYNNTLANCGNYALYGDLTGTAFTNLWIYNNIIINSGGGVIVGVDAGAAATRYFNSVIIANNVYDFGINLEYQPYALGNPRQDTVSAYFINCLAANNISIAGSGAGTDFNWLGWTNYSTNSNCKLSSAQATTNFASYVITNIASIFRPVFTASLLVNVGTNLSSNFTTDAGGAVRGTLWDIGAFEYLATTNVNTLNATTLRATTVIVGP